MNVRPTMIVHLTGLASIRNAKTHVNRLLVEPGPFARQNTTQEYVSVLQDSREIQLSSVLKLGAIVTMTVETERDVTELLANVFLFAVAKCVPKELIVLLPITEKLAHALLHSRVMAMFIVRNVSIIFKFTRKLTRLRQVLFINMIYGLSIICTFSLRAGFLF